MLDVPWLAWAIGFSRVILEKDSELATRWLKGDTVPRGPVLAVVTGCKHMIRRQWEVRIQHCFREQNRSADYLASRSVQHARGVQWIERPLVLLQLILLDDEMGVLCPRKILVTRS
nr:uncharacterized protein LOC109190620 [Ipomoea trifida]